MEAFGDERGCCGPLPDPSWRVADGGSDRRASPGSARQCRRRARSSRHRFAAPAAGPDGLPEALRAPPGLALTFHARTVRRRRRERNRPARDRLHGRQPARSRRDLRGLRPLRERSPRRSTNPRMNLAVLSGYPVWPVGSDVVVPELELGTRCGETGRPRTHGRRPDRRPAQELPCSSPTVEVRPEQAVHVATDGPLVKLPHLRSTDARRASTRISPNRVGVRRDAADDLVRLHGGPSPPACDPRPRPSGRRPPAGDPRGPAPTGPRRARRGSRLADHGPPPRGLAPPRPGRGRPRLGRLRRVHQAPRSKA
jgi:hypothetical protein